MEKIAEKTNKSEWVFIASLMIAIVVLTISGIIIGSKYPCFKAWNDSILHRIVNIGSIIVIFWGCRHLYLEVKELFKDSTKKD